jgi:hypothetical protein
VDRGAVRGGRIGGRHTRRPPRRLTADNGRSGHLVGTEHAVGIRLNEVRGTLALLILAALTPRRSSAQAFRSARAPPRDCERRDPS